MQLTGIITSFNKDWKTGKAIVTLLLDTSDMEHIEKLSKLKKLTITIKRFFKKRSIDANRYFWKLLSEYAEEKEIDTIEEYKERVKRLGIFRVSRVETKDVETYKKSWENWGTAWLCEIYDTEYLGNVEFKVLHLYYGSSSFNSKQMSRLISDLVEDCKEVGIETKSQKEINSLLESWCKNESKNSKC